MKEKSNSVLFKLKAELESQHETKKKLIADEIDSLLTIEKNYKEVVNELTKRNVI